jgi:hypothetical protein
MRYEAVSGTQSMLRPTTHIFHLFFTMQECAAINVCRSAAVPTQDVRAMGRCRIRKSAEARCWDAPGQCAGRPDALMGFVVRGGRWWSGPSRCSLPASKLPCM